MSESYIISNAAKILDIEPHVLRYWEEELDLSISRNPLGHRFYTNEDLDVLKRIKLLKEKGLQLKAIKLLLATANEGIDTDFRIGHKEEITTVNENTAIQNDKLHQFQELMRVIFQTSLRENNDILVNEIREFIAEDMKNINKESEEKAELRFRKLDETLREMQKMRQEVALSSTKKKRFFQKK